MSWCQRLSIPYEDKLELEFGHSCMTQFNGQDLWPKPLAVRVVFSDASDLGYGGHSVENGGQLAMGQWSEWEPRRSCTWRKLRAVRSVLVLFYAQLENERRRWFADDQNMVRIVMHGRRKPILQQEALATFGICIKSRIKLEPEWIPREKNQLSDYLTQLVDYDDWMLSPLIFRQLDLSWGPFTDLPTHAMHSCLNLILAIEALVQKQWMLLHVIGVVRIWWCLPVYLIIQVLKHAKITKASGMLVVPKWLSVQFWPMLYPDAAAAEQGGKGGFSPPLLILGGQRPPPKLSRHDVTKTKRIQARITIATTTPQTTQA